MNYLSVFVLVILLFIKDYPNIEEKTAPATGKSPFAVAPPSAWVDSSREQTDCEHSSTIEPTSFQGPSLFTQDCENNGYDIKGTLEMRLVQKIEQAFNCTVWLMLYSVEQVHRYPLRAWTEKLYTGIEHHARSGRRRIGTAMGTLREDGQIQRQAIHLLHQGKEQKRPNRRRTSSRTIMVHLHWTRRGKRQRVPCSITQKQRLPVQEEPKPHS